MIIKKYFLSILIFIAISILGCGLVRVYYGIPINVKPITIEAIKKFAKRYKIDEMSVVMLPNDVSVQLLKYYKSPFFIYIQDSLGRKITTDYPSDCISKYDTLLKRAITNKAIYYDTSNMGKINMNDLKFLSEQNTDFNTISTKIIFVGWASYGGKLNNDQIKRVDNFSTKLNSQKYKILYLNLDLRK